jgi:hypothetical protein
MVASTGHYTTHLLRGSHSLSIGPCILDGCIIYHNSKFLICIHRSTMNHIVEETYAKIDIYSPLNFGVT